MVPPHLAHQGVCRFASLRSSVCTILCGASPTDPSVLARVPLIIVSILEDEPCLKQTIPCLKLLAYSSLGLSLKFPAEK